MSAEESALLGVEGSPRRRSCQGSKSKLSPSCRSPTEVEEWRASHPPFSNVLILIVHVNDSPDEPWAQEIFHAPGFGNLPPIFVCVCVCD